MKRSDITHDATRHDDGDGVDRTNGHDDVGRDVMSRLPVRYVG